MGARLRCPLLELLMGYWHLASGDLPLAQRGQLQRAYAHGGGGAGRRRGHGGARWGRLGRTRTGEETRRTILPSDWDSQLRPPMVHGPTLVCG